MAAVSKRSNLFLLYLKIELKKLYRIVKNTIIENLPCLFVYLSPPPPPPPPTRPPLPPADTLTQLLRHILSPATIYADGRQYVPMGDIMCLKTWHILSPATICAVNVDRYCRRRQYNYTRRQNMPQQL